MYENLQDFVEEERDGPALLRGALHEYQNIIELLLSSGANAAIQVEYVEIISTATIASENDIGQCWIQDHEGHIASDFNILTQAAEMSDVDQNDGISGAHGNEL